MKDEDLPELIYNEEIEEKGGYIKYDKKLSKYDM